GLVGSEMCIRDSREAECSQHGQTVMFKRLRRSAGQNGVSLIETIVAVAILGIIGTAFFSALMITTSARAMSEERTAAKILAEGIMEHVKKQPYAAEYDVPSSLLATFPGYAADIAVADERNGSIQKITITITHQNRAVLTLEGYKTDRS
ncbi:MAG: prepilin-type N-terminal cleavage/methylation domain-containing protein, partial [Dehalococcoidales bacterium]|nr:prepilin-type N-terminal cleavage/methylation domain-containing protein [Dehalococcoidales bacterium]